MEKKKYPIRAEDYELSELIGDGGSAVVHRARCIPLNEVVAVKILDFERNSDLSTIAREAQIMNLIDHPNIVKAHCSFVNDRNLWVIMPYMAGGSCLHIMKSAYPNGFEEVIIATILREALKGLEYLHQQGHIHRDVKAGNILVDARGGVKLGDFGVSACLFDSGDRKRTRNTFTGTPCWMAPEVMEQLHGYDCKADIWSFGITALELAHGHAPFSSQPPVKVFLMTLNNAPPSLESRKDKKFSKSFKHMIATCLVKDPSKRPTAHKLLKQSFFKQARSHEYVARKILERLPSLEDRFQALKLKDAELLAQKKMLDGEKEAMSQDEYKRGISNWNFDIEDLKAQAALIPDDEDVVLGKYSEGCSSSMLELDTICENVPQGIRSAHSAPLNNGAYVNNEGMLQNQTGPTLHENVPQGIRLAHSAPLNNGAYVDNDGMLQNRTGSTSHGPLDHPLKFQRCRSDVCGSSSGTNGIHDSLQFNGNDITNYLKPTCESEIGERHMEHTIAPSCDNHGTPASYCAPDFLPPFKKESVKQHNYVDKMENCSMSQATTDVYCEAIPKIPKPTASNFDDDEKLKAIVQQRGRFKVTSDNAEFDKGPPSTSGQPKSPTIQGNPQPSKIPMLTSSDSTSDLPGCSLLSQLRCVLETNILQRDYILRIMKQLSAGDSPNNWSVEGMPIPTLATEHSLLEVAEDREKRLLQEIADLQRRLMLSEEELRRTKAKLTQNPKDVSMNPEHAAE